jgi:hypothetical protein
MKIVFSPDHSDLEEVVIPYGNIMRTMVKGVPVELDNTVALGLLQSNPELYKVAPDAAPDTQPNA